MLRTHQLLQSSDTPEGEGMLAPRPSPLLHRCVCVCMGGMGRERWLEDRGEEGWGREWRVGGMARREQLHNISCILHKYTIHVIYIFYIYIDYIHLFGFGRAG